VLGGTNISVNCGVTFPHTLLVDETLTCSYDEDVVTKIGGNNVATVYTQSGGEYGTTEPIDWDAATITEIDKTVNIKDVSDLFGEVDFGSVTAPNDKTITYTKDFAWEDYGADNCGDFVYNNTATIVETEQSAKATLKVNVQCYVYETAYALGDPEGCFIPDFKNWGWTNLISPSEVDYTWDLWAGAGQCDTSKGTLVGSVTVNYDGTNVTYNYNVVAPYLLDETHFYAGLAQYPTDKKGNPTVAPGQYTNNNPFNGEDVFVIAHGVVGIPDPDFGP